MNTTATDRAKATTTATAKRGPVLSRRELATVLAALRYYQNNPEIGQPNAINDVATNGGEFDHMTADNIDDLCERLNCGTTAGERKEEDIQRQMSVAEAADALLKVPEVRKAAANWRSSELVALRTAMSDCRE